MLHVVARLMSFTLMFCLIAVALAARALRPPDLGVQIAFLADPDCPGCDARIGVLYGETYRPVPLDVEVRAFAWSPDGTRLAYVALDAADQTGLYVANADGSASLRINDLHQTDSLSWSPDGEWIAYSRNLNGDSGIFTVRADGTDNRRLTLGLVVMSPVWSPDGERILMQVRGYQGQQIHFVELDGRIANLTGDSTYDYSPVWSPDGEQIAFLSRDRTRTVSPTGVPLTQVFLMDRHGTNVRQISAINGNVFGVRWSPRGDLLALYVAEAQIDLPAWGNLYILDLTHMRLVQITESAQTNSIGDIIWAPDGTRLAYIYNPLGYSWVCVQTLGQRADCRAGDNARKSELQWLTGALLPDLPIPTATPFDPASVTPLPPALRLDKSQKKRD